MSFKCKECGKPLGFDGICWECRARLHRKEVESWSEQEVVAKKQQIRNKLESMTDTDFFKTDEFDLFHDLLSKGIDCSELAPIVLAHNIYYPSELYYKASPEVRDKVIDTLLSTNEAGTGSVCLSALAMIGDEKSQKTLFELKQNPRPWRSKLYVDSDIYAEEGGWTFNENNERIELNFGQCYAFEKQEAASEQDLKAAKIARPREDRCPHCGCKLIDVLVLDGRDKRLEFLGINGIITASCCPSCVAMTEGISSHFELDGRSEVLEFEGGDENFYTDEAIKDLANNHLVLSNEAKPIFYGAFESDINTIGGFANWVQDWEYHTCPKCGKKMKYLAQIHWDTIEECTEGTLFIEVCPDCQITTMFHQQT